MTDLKYFDHNLSQKYSSAENYFEYASSAILKMREVVGEDIIENGLMKKGLIIRHMILPGYTADSIKILEWINSNLGNKTIISIMSQYLPCAEAKIFPELSRQLKPIEYNRVIKKALELGFENAFIQEQSSANEEFIPDFKKK